MALPPLSYKVNILISIHSLYARHNEFINHMQ